jgi:translocation and assembly module TamB
MVLRRALLAFALLLALLVAGAYWLLSRPATLAWAAATLTQASGDALSLHNVSGSLVGVIHIDRVRWRNASGEAVFEQVDLVWSPLALFGGTVAFDRARARTARLFLHDAAPPGVPTAVGRAPVRVRFDAVSVGELIVQRKSELRFLEARNDHAVVSLRPIAL